MFRSEFSVCKKKDPNNGKSREKKPKEPIYLKGVMAKLKKHPHFRDLTEGELEVKARQLTSKEELHADFSHLIDESYEDYAHEMSEEKEANEGNEFIHTLELKEARTRAEMRHRQTSMLQVKLLLRQVNYKPPPRFADTFSTLLSMKLGPLHAAIQVGNVVLEWNNCSLVIPEQTEYQYQIFESDFRSETDGAKVAAQLQPKMADAIRGIQYDELIDLKFDEMVGRNQMLDKLKDLIVKYNRYYAYSLFNRNCQTRL